MAVEMAVERQRRAPSLRRAQKRAWRHLYTRSTFPSAPFDPQQSAPTALRRRARLMHAFGAHRGAAATTIAVAVTVVVIVTATAIITISATVNTTAYITVTASPRTLSARACLHYSSARRIPARRTDRQGRSAARAARCRLRSPCSLYNSRLGQSIRSETRTHASVISDQYHLLLKPLSFEL